MPILEGVSVQLGRRAQPRASIAARLLRKRDSVRAKRHRESAQRFECGEKTKLRAALRKKRRRMSVGLTSRAHWVRAQGSAVPGYESQRPRTSSHAVTPAHVVIQSRREQGAPCWEGRNTWRASQSDPRTRAPSPLNARRRRRVSDP